MTKRLQLQPFRKTLSSSLGASPDRRSLIHLTLRVRGSIFDRPEDTYSEEKAIANRRVWNEPTLSSTTFFFSF